MSKGRRIWSPTPCRGQMRKQPSTPSITALMTMRLRHQLRWRRQSHGPLSPTTRSIQPRTIASSIRRQRSTQIHQKELEDKKFVHHRLRHPQTSLHTKFHRDRPIRTPTILQHPRQKRSMQPQPQPHQEPRQLKFFHIKLRPLIEIELLTQFQAD